MTRFAVAAGHRLTVETTASVLGEGGTAVDAVIAGAAMAMVAEPVLAGLLGGGFLTVREAGGQVRMLDFFVETPRRALPPEDQDFRAIVAEFGTTTQEFHIGAGTIATPGIAPGLAEAHARFGRIPLPDLLAPAVEYARKGVEVTPYQAKLASIVEAILVATPLARALWHEDGALQKPGTLSINPEFGDVLEVFAHEGSRFITEGEIGQALLRLCEDGGNLTGEDLKRYTPRWREPLRMGRGSARVALNPPPSMGGALIAFGLGICPRDPGADELTATLDATRAARIEAALDGDAAAGAGRLLAPEMLARYRAEVSGHPPATRGTTHVSVIDREGMGAALTLSNGEGCGIILPGTGLMPNNMLGEDDLMPDGMHSWSPGQRLSSMMCPMTVDWPDGRFAMLGSGGSNRIRSALVQVLVGLIDRGTGLYEAVEAPRVHVDTGPEPGAPPAVDFEDLGGEEFREAILKRWPEARAWPELSMFFGGVHAVAADGLGNVSAAGDPRRDGACLTG